MSREAFHTVIKLLIASLIVGLVMAMLDVTPLGLIRSLGDNFEEMFASAVNAASWAITYIVMGAVIVVPIWLLFRLLGAKSRRG
jgi:ABC-type arginine/histidine transport system permease subunit